MALQIEKSFVLDAPPAAVWELLTDPHRVARCLPGAALTDQIDERSYAGTITVKVGPVTANYRGKMRFERLDALAREAEIVASGQETRGKGGADMRMTSRVAERAGGGTEVTVVSEVNVVGVLAQFGRGMIQDVSDQLFQRFTDAMRRELEAPADATPPGATAAAGAAAEAVPPGSAAAPAESSASTSAGLMPPGPAAVGATPPRPAAAAAAPPAHRPASTSPAPAPPAGEPALDLGSIGTAAASRAAGRTLRRPGFWITILVLAVILYWFVLR